MAAQRALSPVTTHFEKEPDLMKTLRPLTAALAVTALLALSACGDGESSDTAAGTGAPGEKNVTIRLQTSPGAVNLPELADALGYLEPEGITLDHIGQVQGGPADIQATATGQTDIGAAFAGTVLNVIAAGAKITAVAGATGTDETNSVGFYTLEGSPITSGRDLIGKKVAVATLGAAQEAVLDEWLVSEGLTDDEIAQVELVPLPGPSTEQALRAKQVDVASLALAFQHAAVERGGITELVSDYDVFGPYTVAVYVLHDDFLAENPEKAKAFVTAIGKAGDYAQKTDAAEVIKVYTEYLTENGRAADAEVLAGWKGTGLTAPFGTLTADDFEPWVHWLETFGGVTPGSLDATDVFTNEYNENAES
jgi:ABC-type nitrate/sulfonate/bicarbonate transport system substrate-binding protein